MMKFFFKGVGEWVDAVLTFCVVGEDSPEVIPIPVSLLLLSILFFSEIFQEHALFTILLLFHSQQKTDKVKMKMNQII